MTDTEGLLVQLTSAVRGGSTPEHWREQLSPYVPGDVLDDVLSEFEDGAARIRTFKEPPSLVGRSLRNWYPGPSDDDQFWPPLREYITQAKGWPEEVVDSIDDASTKVVANMQPPGLGYIDTRGLVLGYVQSGKTANFTAVIAKAADVGYRLFIVLSGLHNALRAQTQQRLQQELVELNSEHWITLTTLTDDFKQLAKLHANAVLTQKSHLRLLGVVKKNPWILRRLLAWLQSADQEILANCPVLVIDDEADQASINAAYDPEQRTTINQLLLDILAELRKGAYVGYTATPFANVLIDPTMPVDLYPRDFIIDLPRPNDYLGADTIFGRNPAAYSEDSGADGHDMTRRVPDEEAVLVRPRPKDKEEFQPEVTSSLATALRFFWLATAARWARGQVDEHSTMLVHTSLYVVVHNRFAPVVEAYREDIRQHLSFGDPELEEELRALWDEENRRVLLPGVEKTEFAELFDHLIPVMDATEVIIENSFSDARLSYGDAARVQIVIGGNTLSRGLTLEGLVVSYFVRAASAYDTLLQMGRWFGYRRGYEDLPRIWMTDELATQFRELATVEYELRRDIARYEDLERTPGELAVRIRVHPTLLVTGKMGAAIPVTTDYSRSVSQTFHFAYQDEDVLRRNLEAGDRLLRRIGEGGVAGQDIDGRHHIFLDVPVADVLSFIGDYSFHPDHERLKPDYLANYIERQNKHGGLMQWSVCVIGRRSGPTLEMGGASWTMIQRSRYRDAAAGVADVGAITSPGDESLDLPFVPNRENGGGRGGTHGLLLLYPINKASPPGTSSPRRVPLDAVLDVLGVAIAFPEADVQTPEYVSVQPLLQEQDELETAEDDELEAP